MSTEKVSLTLDEQLVEAAREHAGPRGLSSYVNESVRRQLQRDQILDLLVNAEAAAGPIDDTVMEEVRRAWPAASPRRRRSA